MWSFALCWLVVMELPFSGFELTFIIVAFVIFSLFGLASVCIEPEARAEEGVYGAKKLTRKQRVITKKAGRKPQSKSHRSPP
ncbi:LOW QUALITY PROTEIN: small integral membrane protein 31-like [Spinachia spinachia]